MMPMEPMGDHSAFGSSGGFDTRRAANEEAALKEIKGLSEYHSVAYCVDINHDDLAAEREEYFLSYKKATEPVALIPLSLDIFYILIQRTIKTIATIKEASEEGKFMTDLMNSFIKQYGNHYSALNVSW